LWQFVGECRTSHEASLRRKRVEHCRQRSVYEGNFDTPKTEAGVRRIPISSAAQDLLRAWREASRKTGPIDLLFATWSGKPISPKNVLRQ
jgi:hypothetical protein